MTELRAHRRLTVDFDAFLTAGGLRDHPCKVRDFCLGGALLSFDDPLRTIPPALSMLARGAPVEVRVATRSPGFRDTYTFTASVARREKQQLGVAFTNPDPTSLMALQSLANVNSSQLRTGPRAERRKALPDDASVRAAMAALRACVEEEMAGLPAKLIANARDPINALANAAASDEERYRINDSLATLRRHGSTLQGAFLQQALKPLAEFDKWQPGAIIPAASNSYRLSLIEKGAFEDWLAIKVMVSRAESECQESLFELHIRLNELLGTTLAVQSNPVGPAVFFHALGEPLQKLRLLKPVEQILLRSLESTLLDSLMALYPRLNVLMIGQGILPDLELGKHLRGVAGSTPRPPRPSEKPAPAAANGAAAGVIAPDVQSPVPVAQDVAQTVATPPGPVVDPTVDRTHSRAVLSVRQFELQQRIARQSWETVQRLLAMRRAPSEAPAVESPPAVVAAAPVNTGPDADAVRRLLPEVAGDAHGELSLMERLGKTLGDSPAEKLPTPQLAAVETVDELFSHMLSNTLLRDETRVLLKKLDVPFLRILLDDPAFLTNDKHPARQVFNRLAALGARGALTTEQQQARIAGVVDELTRADGRDPAVFDAALATLDDLHGQQKRIYEHNLRRVQQSSAGRQRLLDARQSINQLIENLLGGQRVPRALLTLLDAGWRESMINTLLRHGVDSDELREQTAVVTEMLQGAQSPQAMDMKGVLGAIKRGLASQANSQINAEAVVSDLREMFTAISAGRIDAVPCVDMPVGMVAVSDVATPQEDSHTLGRWLKRAREINVGDWVEFLADHSEDTYQARLAWRDEACNQFVFVNLQGMKVDDRDVESLARALRDTRAWRIDDPEMPIVDRGLEAMVQKVYGQLAHRATHDELTGLFNRREFERRLQQQMTQQVSEAAPWLLCWLDLDQFKVINSTCGFEAGDTLIVEVARAISGCIGSEAVLARLGGDEFAIFAPAAANDGSLGPVGRVVEAIDSLRFQWQGKVYPVGASAGVVFVTSATALPEDLMKWAETACYAAKEAGRNRVQVFQADDAQLTHRDDTIQWVSRLNQAIENDRLQLRCQMIRPVDVQSGLLPHYEILIAIEDENGEFIPPSSFMQAAERYNRMHAVDRWVIDNTLRWMHEHPERMAAIGGFSINLSGQSLNDEKLMTYILREVMASQVAREKVTFEVTETAAIANLADAADFIREMQAVGCKFSLDDFGSGLSSYSYLKNLPVDFVKIDGVFIREIHKNMSDYMMVRSINELAHFMGKQTIAEYVENDEILAKIREIGIDFAQGYGIERPQPLHALVG